MDAVEFQKEEKRMFESNGAKNNAITICHGISCAKCRELYDGSYCEKTAEEKVATVERWSEEHPVITNADKFKEVFGTEPTNDMLGWICPPLSVRKYKCDDRYCPDCQNWWRAEYKEPEKEVVK